MLLLAKGIVYYTIAIAWVMIKMNAKRGIEPATSLVIWSHDTYDRTHTINHFTTVACKYILFSNICTSLGQTKYIQDRVCYTPSGTIVCEFNGDVRFTIGLTRYGNFSKYGSVYMFLVPFFEKNSTVTLIM